MEEVRINKENIQKTYAEFKDSPMAQSLLISLFGKENVEPEKQKDITERIKTFEDALDELGYNRLVEEWQEIDEVDVDSPDLIAYLKLRIICAALNEGWKPQFTEDEIRWYPWFYLYTQEEINEKSDDWKQSRHLIGTGEYHGSYCGFAFAYSYYAPSNTFTNIGSRLCLKSEALASYCGTQFIELWADFTILKK